MFATCHVFTNLSPGLRADGAVVTSRMNPRLLHPDANEEGFTVGVYCVPVAVTAGYTMDVIKGMGVEDVIGDGNESGVELAMEVGVFIGVDVAGGTIAVCVWKK